MDVKLIAASTDTPVSLDEARDALFVTADTWDAQIERCLRQAADFCQRRIPGHRQFMSATYEAVWDGFPVDVSGRIELPYPPLQRVIAIRYYDPDGVLRTFGSTSGSSGSTAYYTTVAPAHAPGYIGPAYDEVWPATRLRADAVQVRFLAGYPSSDDVPDSLKAAVTLKLQHLWDPGHVDENAQRRAIDDLLLGNCYGAY